MSHTIHTLRLVIQTLCPAYAIVRGGAPERVAAAAIAAGAVATRLSYVSGVLPYWQFEKPAFAIDTVLLLLLAILAIRANRFWPIWCLAAHLVGWLAGLARLGSDLILPTVYYQAQAYGVYAMWATVVAGAWRHRQRLALLGTDPSWKVSSPSSSREPRRPGQS